MRRGLGDLRIFAGAPSASDEKRGNSEGEQDRVMLWASHQGVISYVLRVFDPRLTGAAPHRGCGGSAAPADRA